jgi:excisionase family DNA binding protein
MPLDVCGVKAQLLKAPEVAKLLAIGRTTVYELIAAGVLPVTRIGTAVRVPCQRLWNGLG